MNHTHIHGFFDFEAIYDEFVAHAASGDVIVEVGCYLGKSACYLGQRIKDSGKQISLVCVDNWPAVWVSEGGQRNEYPYDNFIANVRQCGLSDIITPLRATSSVAAHLLRDGLACVFIDASHKFEDVRDDIAMWRGKVKRGGLLAGHDYSVTYPGVPDAVNAAFGQPRIVGQSWIVTL